MASAAPHPLKREKLTIHSFNRYPVENEAIDELDCLPEEKILPKEAFSEETFPEKAFPEKKDLQEKENSRKKENLQEEDALLEDDDFPEEDDLLEEDGLLEEDDLLEENDLEGERLLEETPRPSDMKYEHFRFVVDKGQGLLRIDKYLSVRIEGISRNRIRQAADADCILVNGKAVRSSYKVKPLDEISIVMDWPKRHTEILPENIPLDIVYEDDTVMVINKPPGMVVHPGHGNYTGTLVNAVAYHLGEENIKDVNDPRLGLVHRIDKDTSGLLLVAKTPEAKSRLSAQFFRKETKRLYTALVWGNFDTESGTIEGNIGRDPKDRMLMRVFPDGEQGKPAVTHYRVSERFGYVSLVECQLETGRTHQIRVHMKEIGHPLFNDERYGGNVILRGTRFAKYRQFIDNCFAACPRQCLHARTIGFRHPKTGKEMLFDSAIPEDMQTVIDKWRSYTGSNEYLHRELSPL